MKNSTKLTINNDLPEKSPLTFADLEAGTFFVWGDYDDKKVKIKHNEGGLVFLDGTLVNLTYNAGKEVILYPNVTINLGL